MTYQRVAPQLVALEPGGLNRHTGSQPVPLWGQYRPLTLSRGTLPPKGNRRGGSSLALHHQKPAPARGCQAREDTAIHPLDAAEGFPGQRLYDGAVAWGLRLPCARSIAEFFVWQGFRKR